MAGELLAQGSLPFFFLQALVGAPSLSLCRIPAPPGAVVRAEPRSAGDRGAAAPSGKAPKKAATSRTDAGATLPAAPTRAAAPAPMPEAATSRTDAGATLPAAPTRFAAPAPRPQADRGLPTAGIPAAPPAVSVQKAAGMAPRPAPTSQRQASTAAAPIEPILPTVVPAATAKDGGEALEMHLTALTDLLSQMQQQAA
eukprot:CAMPEP_0117478430 /NCGR_PEP_ID=MMETSP0784-20121206/11345_1 /TAXON_ID=39447 /ORGANISM="" /LENGTH=197 /DNA_ID=CAMNT_0005272785 /DNA_START=116 /DNA_END=710 /DNA_ORIENTATION=-